MENRLLSPSTPGNHSNIVREYTPESSMAVLGNGLLWDQVQNIYDEFAADELLSAANYWDDIREFYGVNEADAEHLPLHKLAEKYNLSSWDRDYAEVSEASGKGQTLDSAKRIAEINVQSSPYFAKPEQGQTQKNKENLSRDISSFKEQLLYLFSDPARRQDVEEHLVMPPSIDAMRTNQDGKTVGWSEWLLDVATDEQIMNFVQAHHHYMEKINGSDDFVGAVIKQKQEYQAVLEKFSSLGLMKVPDDIESRLAAVKVTAGDVLSMHLYGYGGLAYNRGESERHVIVTMTRVEKVTKHELNHVLLGSYQPRWLNEAVTEHIAQCMKLGEVKEIGEILEEGVYIEERRLLDAVMTMGLKTIDLSEVLDGYTDEDKEPFDDVFSKAVGRAWGPDALMKISIALVYEEQALAANGVGQWQSQKQALANVRSKLLKSPEEVLGVQYSSDVKDLKNILSENQ